MKRKSDIPAAQLWLGAARRAQLQWCVASAVLRLQWSLLLVGMLAWPGLMLARQASLWHAQMLGIALGVVAVALVLEALVASWRRRPSIAELMVCLEVAGNHHGQLLAAHEGRAAWPSCPQRFGVGWQWRWNQCALRPALAMLAIAAGACWPLAEKAPAIAIGEPPTWQMTEQELRALAQEKWIDPASIQPVVEQIEQWRAQPAEQWLTPAALEASDQLWREHQQSTEQWRQQVEQLQQAAQNLQQPPEATNAAQTQRAVEQWQEALDAMDAARLKPNAELQKQLQQLDPKHAKIDPKRLQALSDKLRQHAAQLKKMQAQRQGQAWAEGLDEQGLAAGEAEEMAKNKSGSLKPGGKNGKSGGKPGSGGVNEGGGHDSQLLGDSHAPQVLGDAQNLENEDDSRVAQGDLLELERQRHEVSQAPSTLQDGGRAAANRGGERVWRESLQPDEQRSLKRFFDAE